MSRKTPVKTKLKAAFGRNQNLIAILNKAPSLLNSYLVKYEYIQ